MTTLSDAVSLADWQEVVGRAVADAKAGDARARDWLTRYLIGERPPRLLDVAASEARGLTAEAEINAAVMHRQSTEEYNARLDNLFSRLGDQ